jgi:ribulose-5-phosphate 4-epimerase/fuculose-1-phosphate aldolase
MNLVPETEGVVKYRLDFVPGEPPQEDIRGLNVWRSILFRLGLIGQNAQRYQGYGFGNLSQRSTRDPLHFIISGTQTGHVPVLDAEHYVEVESCDIARNRVCARGRVEPSSEALTHAMFYRLNEAIQCVIHIHSPALWRFGLQQQYPATGVEIEYGTPQMALEIERLFRQDKLAACQTLMMAGHEDGVICFGNSVDQAALALVKLWVDAQS